MNTDAALDRTTAHGLAFELIDALGEEGAVRFYAEHRQNNLAIMGLMDAMLDHDMSTETLIKAWRVEVLERTKIAGFPFYVAGFNLYTGNRFSWLVPDLNDERYDLSAVAPRA